MKKIFILLLSLIFFNQQCYAVTLSEALIQAYNNNLELNAERENIKISEQDLKISRSGFLPSLIYSGSKSQEETSKLTNNNDIELTVNDADPLTHSIIIEQTLIDFGKSADLSKNKIGIDIAKAKLLKKEQEILLKAAEAFTGLIFAKKKLKINQSNLQLLERQVETDQARLERGQITLVDLAQSESSLAGANAKLISAETELATINRNFERIVGASAPKQFQNIFQLNINLPNGIDTAITLSGKNNPKLVLAKLEYEIASKEVTIEKSKFSPSALLNYSQSKNRDYSSTVDSVDQEDIKATVTWPLFKGGENYSSFKKAKFKKEQYNLIFLDTTNEVKTDTYNAWSIYKSSAGILTSTQAAVKAAEIANEGITLEYDSGSKRTTLEVIQSRSLLLDSRISKAKAERDFAISKFQLLFVLGELTLENIKKS